ncbi:MAG: DNA cytosine methyltransferase [Gammaproteobacteria bacterium]|nr:DNA cytosine methyltransferase [Gammaproteobacteria bacterium]
MKQSSDITTFSDLFCGIGGFHYAANQLGLECVFACDIDQACREQYKHNFGFEPAADIKLVRAEEVPDHDVLFAGFSCQPFSIIGDRRGLDDRRGTLYHEILRIVSVKKPKALVLENVRQFSTNSNGRALNAVLVSLSNFGYSCQWKILNALDFGLPQKRERVIVVGLLRPGVMDLFQWPKPIPNYKPLADVLEQNPAQRHFASETIRKKRMSRHLPKTSPAIWHENKGGNVSSSPFSCVLRANASHNYLLVDGERRLTPREQLRLQGFPESFEVIGSDSQIRKQVGNAVPIPMIRSVVEGVLSAHSQIKMLPRFLHSRRKSTKRHLRGLMPYLS